MIAAIALHLWQSTLCLLVAWALARVCRRNAAAVRYWIWFGASVKFLVPFALLQQLGSHAGRSLPAPLPLDPVVFETGNAIFVPAVPGWVASHDGSLSQTLVLVAAVWMLGTAILLVRWWLQWRVIHSIVAAATPVRMDVTMDLPVPVHVTGRDVAAGVFGIFRPVVILPRPVLSTLGIAELQAVLAHEACHVRRNDNLTAAIHKCVEALFWFHPLVWWAGTNLLREREAACDEAVLEEGHQKTVYAESILQVCRMSVTATSAGLAASTGGNLVQRVSSIMKAQRASPMDHGRFALLLGTAMIACYGPIAAGVVTGAIREAANAGPIVFDVVTLKPPEPNWWRSTQFDRDAGRLALNDVSLRDLIALAYPGSTLNADPEFVDRVHYDIEARWRGRGDWSERNVYRELLMKILSTNSNLQLHVRK